MTPSSSAAIWASVVSRPWPCDGTPVKTVEPPRGVGADGRALERPHAGQLDVARDAHAQQPARLPGVTTFLRQALVVSHLERTTEHGGIVAAVVDHVARAAIVRQAHVVRHVRRLHQIGEAHRGAVAAGLAGDEIHHPLDDEHGLRLARPAVRRDGNAVRVDAVEGDLDVGDAVRAREHGGAQQWHDQPARRVGARVVHESIAQRQEPALVVESDLDRMDLRALLGRRQHVLQTVLEPPHGSAETQCQEGDQDVLGIDDQLGAEAPAHVRRHHAHPMRLQPEQLADELPHLVRDLRRRPHREELGDGVVLGDEPARLHRLTAGPADAQRHARTPGRRVQRGLDVTAR